MIRTKHDRFSKEFLAELLDPFGKTEIDVSVTSEAREIDLLFTPQTGCDPSGLGLLGRIAQTSCIIEPYRNAPDDEDIRICLMRLAIQEGELRRKAKREKIPLAKKAIPFVWVVAPTMSQAFLGRFCALGRENWPKGVYFLAEGLRTIFVAVHQLPVMPETLWLRVLGRGRVQGRAVQEVLALPESSPERSQVLRLVKNWQIRVQQNQEPEGTEMAVQLSQAYLEWERVTRQEAKLEGKIEGKLEGWLEGKLATVPALLKRGLSVEEIAQILELTVEQVQSSTTEPRAGGSGNGSATEPRVSGMGTSHT